MPNYASLSTQITDIKNEISSSLAASAYTAQDLVYVAKALEALSHVVAPDDADEITINNNIYIGSTAEAWSSTAALTNPTLVVRKTANDYAQIAFQNSSNGADASTDFIAYSNNGDDNSGWIDMGITSSNFNDPQFTITGPGDGYIFVAGSENGSSDRGNLVLATSDTGTQNKIIFAAGGLASDNEQMSITPDQNVHIEIATASTSPSTGALTIVGGVGVQGDVNIAGNITFGGTGTTVQTGSLAVDNSIIFVGNNNTTDSVDLGLLAEYATAATPSTNTITNKALTSNVATLTTGTAHGYVVGDIAVITGVDATFNGTKVITSVPTTTTFTFAKEAGNVSSTAVSPVGSVTVSSKRRFAGVVRDASDTTIKFFQDATTKPTSTINFSEAGLTYADIQVDDITADVITANSLSVGNVDNTEIQYLNGVTSSIQTQLNAKADTTTLTSTYAPLASPALTGTPTAPTASANTNTTQVATTAFVLGQANSTAGTIAMNGTQDAGASNLYARADHVHPSDTSRAPLASPALTGTPTAPTAAVDTATSQIATTAYVVNQSYLKASTASSTYAPLTNATLTTPTLTRPVLTSAFETNTINTSTGQIAGTVNVDIANSSVIYYTQASSANWTFNFRGTSSLTLNSVLGTNQSATVALLITNGATPYIPSAFTIDGASVTPRWQGGVAPSSGNANSIDAYTFTIIKTAASTYTVLASQVRFA